MENFIVRRFTTNSGDVKNPISDSFARLFAYESHFLVCSNWNLSHSNYVRQLNVQIAH